MPALLRLNVLTAALRAAVSGLDDEQLDTPYREGGVVLKAGSTPPF